MVDFCYFEKGLTGLARAHRAGGMAGHLGAGVLAGYFFGEQNPEVDSGVVFGVERDLERIMAGEEDIWFRPEKTGVTVAELFASNQKAAGQVPEAGSPASEVADALRKSTDELRQSGHNVIFGSIAIRALNQHPEFGSPEVVGGIVKLMRTFETVGQGRGYFGKETGWKQGAAVKAESSRKLECRTPSEAAELALDLLIEMAGEHQRGFGGLFHLIDHAAAIVELSDAGCSDLAVQALNGFVRHAQLLDSLPVLEEELGALRKSEQSPWEADYWKRRGSQQYSAWLTHRIKVLYGLGVLLPLVEDEEKQAKAKSAFLYLMA